MRFRIPAAFVLLAAFLGSGTALATASGPSISEFETGLTPGVQLWGITSGPDGNTWFTEENNNAVGRVTPGAVITEFSAGFPTGSPRGIVTGPDGNLWVAQAGGDGGIARVTKAGDVTEFPVPTAGDPNDIAVGADGNLWYVDPTANVIGRITPTGSITEFTDGLSDDAEPTSIVKGPDSRLWFTEQATGKIGAITTAGVITEFSSNLSGSDEPADIVAGPDGKLWFTLTADPGGIGRISTTGDVMKFSAGLTMNSKPLGIAAGPDGALWFTESAAPGRIGRVTTSGEITEYSSGLVAITNPWFIAAGPDGNMWFTGNNSPGRVARITLPPLVKELAADQIGITSARLRGRVRPNSQATSYHFEYGPTADYGMATQTAYAGSSYDLMQVLATVDGLAPAAKYHYRVVAENDAGVTIGPDRVFATASLPPTETAPPVAPPPAKPEPEFAKTIVAEGEDVRFKTPGGTWHDLPDGAELPVGVALDARRGSVNLQSAGCRGGVQTGTFGGGVFSVRQPRSGCGRVDVYLRGGSFKRCARLPGRASARRASASKTRRVRRLWGRDSGGKFRSHGRHSHATVRGTRWLTEDRCDGTLTRVTNGAVVVRDYKRRRNVLVRAGHSYLAKARARAHRR
jgi:streptogramin lyase